jgi:Family of unknown function (DUF6338)
LPDIAVSASDVGALVTYVAPGFLARLGWRTRFPGPDRPAGEVLIVSAVISLPLVALAGAVLTGTQKPTQVGYVLGLLSFSVVLGYLAAALRGCLPVKEFLARRLDYRLEPEGSIYAQTLKHLAPGAAVTVEFKDGRKVSGTPRNGPQDKGDGINELYLTHPCALTADGQWRPVGAGLIVPLGEVSSIVLSEEPTGAG